MNVLLSLLEEFKFVRTDLNLSKPLIVHAVPGAGKTTLLRKFLSLVPNSEVLTFGEPDKGNLSGRFIRKYTEIEDKSKFLVVDEYLSGDLEEKVDALFSDPFQNISDFPKAHFIKEESLRVPKAICDFLVKQKFQIKSEVAGVLEFADFFGADPVGTVIAFQEEVISYLKSFGVNLKLTCEVRGLEFDEVTIFIDPSNLSEKERVDLFIGATRAKNKLILRATDAFDCSA